LQNISKYFSTVSLVEERPLDLNSLASELAEVSNNLSFQSFFLLLKP